MFKEFLKFHKFQVPEEVNCTKLLKALEKELKIDMVRLDLEVFEIVNYCIRSLTVKGWGAIKHLIQKKDFITAVHSVFEKLLVFASFSGYVIK